MIQKFYNTTAIKETYTIVTDSYGQEIKTWLISTTIEGIKQSRSGDLSIVNNIEKIRVNERFYCDNLTISVNDRLLFSTKIYIYKGTSSGSSVLTSTDYGALYFCTSTFSTYSYGDYVRYSSVTTAYAKENFSYYKILYVNNLENRHIQIDIKEDSSGRY